MKKIPTAGSGIAVILTALSTVLAALTDSDPATVPDWNVVIGQILTGVGLMRCRPVNMSSEEAGAAKPGG